MIASLVARWAVLVVAIGLTAALLPNVEIDGALSLIGISVIFAFVNVFLGAVLRLLTLPLTVVTLGLFTLVVNGVLFAVTDWLSSSLDVDGFLPAVVGALVISVISTLLNLVVARRTPQKA